MDIRVLGTDFVAIDILEGVDSILWTDRYGSAGEFEIYTKYDPYFLSLLQENRYLTCSDSDRTMVIESINIKSDPEDGDKLIVKGRSLESILDRRIIFEHFQATEIEVYEAIRIAVEANVLYSIYPERNFPGFVYTTPTDPLITTPTTSLNYHGDNLYDVVTSLCNKIDIGFKIVLDSLNHFVFSLYVGDDRSYDQITNQRIIFSPEMDNLKKSDYFKSRRYKKNYILVIGQPFGGWIDRGQAWTPDVGTGLNRLETSLDGSYVPRTYIGTDTEIPVEEYQAQLDALGLNELLLNYQELAIFDGQVDLSNSYKYQTDFFLGDIIQLVDAYGHSSRVRISEITLSESVSGYAVYPTLKSI